MAAVRQTHVTNALTSHDACAPPARFRNHVAIMPPGLVPWSAYHDVDSQASHPDARVKSRKAPPAPWNFQVRAYASNVCCQGSRQPVTRGNCGGGTHHKRRGELSNSLTTRQSHWGGGAPNSHLPGYNPAGCPVAFNPQALNHTQGKQTPRAPVVTG